MADITLAAAWGLVPAVLAVGATAAVGMSLVHLARLFPEWIPEAARRDLPAAVVHVTVPAPSPQGEPQLSWKAIFSTGRRVIGPWPPSTG